MAPVDVFRDPLGIPHVRAASVREAFFAQGYVHAQDRLWQMVFDRHRAAGRLAELLGPRAVAGDAFMRRMGLVASARRDLDAFDDPTTEVLEAYAAGVNAFIDGGRMPVELERLEVVPERWEPWHCGSVIKVRHVLMGTYSRKLWRARLLAAFGQQAVIDLASADASETTVIVPVGGATTWRADPGELAVAGRADGSNSWAVHGTRTSSGLPLLAGDPHRALEVPNVYYQNHLACPDFDVIGLSMAGVPGMFHFGHNSSVAWCVTHGMADTQDLFLERLRSDGTYAFRGEWLEAERSVETISVRGDEDVKLEIVRTHHGPVVFQSLDGSPIAMRWTGTAGPNTTLQAILPMMRVTSVAELDEVMRVWVDPCNSFLMADRHGDIAYLHRGRIPVRSRANAWVPVPGWTGEHEWEGDVPYEDLPRLRNPETGFIATANNRVLADGDPYLSLDYAAPNRARRVIARLESLTAATVEDMSAIHADRLSIPARGVVDALLALPWEGRAAEAAAVLAEWDHTMDPGSAGACIYAAARQAIAETLCEREPLRQVAAELHDGDPDPTLVSYRVRVALTRLLSRRHIPPLDVVDTDDVLREGFERAVETLAERLGSDPAAWRWGEVHRTAIAHPLKPEYDDLEVPHVGTGGDGDCVQASGAEDGLGVEHTSVARYVFDLADWDRSAWVVPLGSSGDPASPHYADQAEAWSRVELFPMTYSWGAIETGAEAHERLEPQLPDR